MTRFRAGGVPICAGRLFGVRCSVLAAFLGLGEIRAREFGVLQGATGDDWTPPLVEELVVSSSLWMSAALPSLEYPTMRRSLHKAFS